MSKRTISRRWIRGGLVVGAAATALTVVAGPASAVSIVEHTHTFEECHFDPGDVPGVNTSFPATCTFVHEPSGNLQVVARASLPEGYSLTETYRSAVFCTFNGVQSTGTIVATKSGQVVATCKIPGGA